MTVNKVDVELCHRVSTSCVLLGCYIFFWHVTRLRFSTRSLPTGSRWVALQGCLLYFLKCKDYIHIELVPIDVVKCIVIYTRFWFDVPILFLTWCRRICLHPVTNLVLLPACETLELHVTQYSLHSFLQNTVSQTQWEKLLFSWYLKQTELFTNTVWLRFDNLRPSLLQLKHLIYCFPTWRRTWHFLEQLIKQNKFSCCYRSTDRWESYWMLVN